VTVRIILPDTEVRALRAKRRVAAFSGLRSRNRMTAAALIAREANSSGIIRLTFTA
jgi:hypothetical protein